MAPNRTEHWRTRATITVEEAAPILGIGRASAYKAAQAGELPTLRIGRRLLVPVAKLRQILGELPVPPDGVVAHTLNR